MSSSYRRLLLVAGMASLLDSAAIISVGSALPVWRSAFGLGDWTVGAISATLTVSIAVGALLGGRLADVVGRARVFASTVGLYAVGAAIIAAADGPAGLVAGVVVLGLASGADLPASLALVADRVPTAVRARSIALTQVLWTVGIVMATLLALVASPYGVPGTRAVFVVLALGALATVLARRTTVVPVAGPVPDPAPLAEVPATATDRRALLVLVAVFYLLYTLVANTFGSFRTYFLVVVGGAGQTLATAVSFGLTLLGLVGTLVFSLVVGTPWRRRLFPWGVGVLVVSLAVVAATGARSFSVAVVAFVAYTLVYPYVGEGLYKVWAQEVVPDPLRATFQGATIAAARAAAAAFAVVTPTLLSHHPATLFWVLAACGLGAGAVGSQVLRRQVRLQA